MVASLQCRLLSIALAVAACAYAARADCRLDNGPTHTVTRIIDGETVVLDDGSRVRLVGALAPRGDDAAVDGAWPAEDMSKEELASLAQGRAVRLKFGGTKVDRHGQRLAHLFLIDDGGERWLQAELLARGQARAYAIDGNRACEAALRAAEIQARSTGLGLWSVPAYRVRDGGARRDLAPYQGTFQILTGRVRAVSQQREVVRFWLGPDRQRDVSITIRAKDRDLLGGFGGDPKALDGRQIEVRGWLGLRRGAAGGLEIDVSTAGMISVLDAR